MRACELGQHIKMIAAKFSSQDPHGRRGELTPENCPLTSACM